VTLTPPWLLLAANIKVLPSPGMQHPSTCAYHGTQRTALSKPHTSLSYIVYKSLRRLSLHHAPLLSNINTPP
jgi:hypothetical protein